jgi:hypothetical protein
MTKLNAADAAPRWPQRKNEDHALFKVDEPGQDREILSLYDAFLVAQAAVDFWKENQLSSELGEAAHERWWECVDAIVAMPISTTEGIRVKAATALLCVEADAGTVEIRALLADITKLARAH